MKRRAGQAIVLGFVVVVLSVGQAAAADATTFPAKGSPLACTMDYEQTWYSSPLTGGASQWFASGAGSCLDASTGTSYTARLRESTPGQPLPVCGMAATAPLLELQGHDARAQYFLRWEPHIAPVSVLLGVPYSLGLGSYPTSQLPQVITGPVFAGSPSAVVGVATLAGSGTCDPDAGPPDFQASGHDEGTLALSILTPDATVVSP